MAHAVIRKNFSDIAKVKKKKKKAKTFPEKYFYSTKAHRTIITYPTLQEKKRKKKNGEKMQNSQTGHIAKELLKKCFLMGT